MQNILFDLPPKQPIRWASDYETMNTFNDMQHDAVCDELEALEKKYEMVRNTIVQVINNAQSESYVYAIIEKDLLQKLEESIDIPRSEMKWVR